MVRINTTLWSIFFMMISGLLMGQNAVLSSGGDALSSTGSISYSVGQVVYTAHESNYGSTAQGVQQPYEFFISTGIEWLDHSIEVSIFPNPVVDELHIEFGEEVKGEFTYQIFDILGTIVRKGGFDQRQNTLPVFGLPPAPYLLNVYYNGRYFQSFQFVKN